MGRGPSIFRQRDLTRAIKGARAAGEKVERIEIGTDGKLVIFTGEGKNGWKIHPPKTTLGTVDQCPEKLLQT